MVDKGKLLTLAWLPPASTSRTSSPPTRTMSKRRTSTSITPSEAAIQLHKEGWLPFEPSAECRARLSRPDFPKWLDEEDRIGLHAVLAYFEVFRRFPKLRATGVPDIVSALVAHQAVLGNQELVQAEHSAFRGRLKRWYDERFVPSLQRFTPEMNGSRPSTPSALEPAWTFHRLWSQRFPTDFEFNRRSLTYAMWMVEEDGVLEGQPAPALGGISASDEAVAQFIDMVMGLEPGRHLFYFSESGGVRLGAREVKRAQDKFVGKVVSVEEQDHGQDVEHVVKDARDRRELAPPKVAEDIEVTELVHQQLMRLRSEADEDSLEAAVLENYVRIKDPDDEFSARRLSEERDVSRETVRRAVAAVSDELVRRLGA